MEEKPIKKIEDWVFVDFCVIREVYLFMVDTYVYGVSLCLKISGS